MATAENELTTRNGTAMVPRGPAAPAIATDEHRQILRGMVDRSATPAQVEMLIVVGNRYGLDPIMGHVVLINGKCFVTHKGLLHKAHASGVFDGMETTYGADDRGDFCECCVWRTDMTRPTRGRIYIDEYKSAGPVWKQFPSAMAAKTAESFVLRRAFDVSLTSQEEMGVADAPPAIPVGPSERQQIAAHISEAVKQLTQEQRAEFKRETEASGGIKTYSLPHLLALQERIGATLRENINRANVRPEAGRNESAKPDEDDPFADDSELPAASGPAVERS